MNAETKTPAAAALPHLEKTFKMEKAQSEPNPIDILQEWMRSLDAKKSTARYDLSAEEEYQEAKDEFQTLICLRRALSDLTIKKGLKLRELSENLSPLLSLKRIFA